MSPYTRRVLLSCLTLLICMCLGLSVLSIAGAAILLFP
jgi:hypothetical protein